jgi:16S rRNA (cytosine967-C5)-methyltransferase
LASRASHPDWLVQAIATAWPDQLEDILDAGNARPPLTLRVNLARQSREHYLQKLSSLEIKATPGLLADSAIYLSEPIPVNEIPGFAGGEVSVQDEASQLVAGTLRLEPGLLLLDACAAPGGKTSSILESERSLTRLIAIDRDKSRLSRIEENLQRLQLEAELVCADAAILESWWDGEAFDRVLLDAPCSATGVIRRHPDIKLLRTPEQVTALLATQQQLLHQLWQCLKSGGLLLYTTCSILPEENQAQIQQFLDSHNDAKYEGITADWGVECESGRQLLPSTHSGTDGFFFSLLRKC